MYTQDTGAHADAGTPAARGQNTGAHANSGTPAARGQNTEAHEAIGAPAARGQNTGANEAIGTPAARGQHGRAGGQHRSAGEPPALLLPSLPEWHSRGYMPHREYQPLQFITYRLFDSVPAQVIQTWKDELQIGETTASNDPKMQELHSRIEQYEDAGYGQCFLKDARIAEIVQNNLLHFDGIRYHLINWCIMPNHVHVLIEVMDGWTLSTIIHSWRSYTSHAANRVLGRSGTFWQKEYFDRYIRDDRHFRSVMCYIDNNPIKTGLADDDHPWPYAGAYADVGAHAARGQMQEKG